EDGSTLLGSNSVSGAGGVIAFHSSATAGTASFVNSATGQFNSALAASGTFDSLFSSATLVSLGLGGMLFFDSSTAAGASITNLSGGLVGFTDSSTAGSASITLDPGGFAAFAGAADAANATITMSATSAGIGALFFGGSATAGHAHIVNGGTVNISGFTLGAFVVFGHSATAGKSTLANHAS